MTAELAVAFPAVVLVLACCLSGMAVAGQQVRITDAAALAARALARGEDPGALATRLVPGSRVARGGDGDLACVTLSLPTALVGLLPVTVSARSCALGGGR